MTSVPETTTPITAAPEASAEPPAGPRKITAEEIAKHADESSAWMSIHGKVYDLTKFATDEHPGGLETLLDKAGQDATDDFEDIGHSDQARNMLPKYEIGDLEGPPRKAPKDESSGGGGTMVNLALFGALTAAVAVYMGVSLEMIKLGFA